MAIAVEKSAASKLGQASATYAGRVTCPSSCPFLGITGGCYAEHGNVRLHFDRTSRGAGNRQAAARAEARAIGSLSGKRPLRLHVSGDCATASATRTVAAAADRYRRRHAQAVWSYTHAWARVPRAAWGRVSVLASVETLSDAWHAIRRGYAPAIVLNGLTWRLMAGKARVLQGLRVIPCPAQARDGITCDTCKLCWHDGALLARKAVIAFAPHGSDAKQVEHILQERKG